MSSKTDWSEAIRPLLQKYDQKKHPLEYKNVYQLLVMVVLSARDTDDHINQLAPEFFKAFPDMEALSKATPESLFPYMRLRNFGHKANWLITIAQN
jgi:endonuclease-3